MIQPKTAIIFTQVKEVVTIECDMKDKQWAFDELKDFDITRSGPKQTCITHYDLSRFVLVGQRNQPMSAQIRHDS